jgi:hypothetical protein
MPLLNKFRRVIGFGVTAARRTHGSIPKPPGPPPGPPPAAKATTTATRSLGLRHCECEDDQLLLDSDWPKPNSSRSDTMSHDSRLRVQVVDSEIIVTLPGFRYAVTYYKPRRSPQPMAKNIASEDDPRAPMKISEFLARAWRLANDKARELEWIV